MYSWLHPSAQLCFVTQGKKCKSWSEFCTMTPALFMPLPITGNILLRDTELRCEWCSARSKVAVSSFHIVQRVLILQASAVNLLVLGSCEYPDPTCYGITGEPRDITGKSPPGVAVCNMQWSSICTGTFFQPFCLLYATKVAWADHSTWQIVFHWARTERDI